MKWSYRIAQVAGIDVRLHATFLLLLAFLAFQNYQYGGVKAAFFGVLFVALLFLCVLLHEFGHAFAARAYGIRTPDITLLPIGGVARLARIPDNPVQELLIAIAGPMVNVVIGCGLWFGLGMPSRGADFITLDQPLRSMTFHLMEVNAMLVIFNLIPAFPMDGGRMLRALLALRIGHAKATQIAARTGQVISVIFALVGVFGIPGFVEPNFFLLFIAMFVYMGAQQEAMMASMRSAVAGMRISDAMITHFQTLPADMLLTHAAELALHGTQPVYPITDASLRPQGMVLRNELLQAAANSTPSLTAASLAQTIPTVASDASFDEAFRLMQESSSPVLPVVNPGGQVIGLVSLNLLSERARLHRR